MKDEKDCTALPVIIPEGTTVVVKNVMSSSVTAPPEGYDSRLSYWEKHSGIKPTVCAHEVCARPATEGAMAVRAFSADRRRYVFPACETCARRTEMLYVKGPLVSVE